jgi:hypothetical protein
MLPVEEVCRLTWLACPSQWRPGSASAHHGVVGSVVWMEGERDAVGRGLVSPGEECVTEKGTPERSHLREVNGGAVCPAGEQ